MIMSEIRLDGILYAKIVRVIINDRIYLQKNKRTELEFE